MLATISSDLVDEIVSGRGGATRDALDALENLLRAHREGKHIFAIRPEQQRKLDRVAGFSLSAKGAMKASASKWADYGGLAKVVAARAEITTARLPMADGLDGSQLVFLLPYTHFLDSERTQRSVVIGENLSDSQFYIRVAAAFVASKRWGIEVCAEPRNGGGSTTYRVYSEACDAGRFVVGLADSDRTCPDSGLGDTALDLLRVAKGRPKFQLAYVLSVRAVENLFSVSLLKGVLDCRKHPFALSALERLQKLKSVSVEAGRYVNLKTGFRLYEYECWSGDEAECRFWKPVVLKIGIPKCDASRRCMSREECSCFLIPSLGMNVLDAVVDGCVNMTPHKLAELLYFGDDAELARIGELVAAWCCATKRTVA